MAGSSANFSSYGILRSMRIIASIYAYANDLVITTKGISRAAVERRLNLSLERVNKWTRLNKLALSIDKCKYMITGIKKMLRNPIIKIGNENIKRTKTYKYLGLLIDEGLTFHEHAKGVKGEERLSCIK